MKEVDTSTIGGRIRSIRKSLPQKMSIKEFGKSLGGISQVAMNAYELNNNTPPPAVIELICQKYNVNPLYLRCESDVMFIPPDEDEEVIDRALADGDPILKALLLGIVKKPDGWRMLAESILTAADTLRDAGLLQENKKPED